MDLQRTVALITGAGQGLGRAIALRLATSGSIVVVADLNLDAARSTADEIRVGGGEALPLQVNVSDVDQIRAMVDTALRELGNIDVLVTCAGIAQAKDIFSIEEADWDAVFSVNAKGTFFTNQIVLKHMCERGSGSIVNMASIAGRGPRPMLLPYAASKAAVISITRSAAAAVGHHGVRVNAVCPGVIATPMWAKLSQDLAGGAADKADDARRAAASRSFLPRDETAEDVANVVAFLVSEQGSYITGQSINVCGGIEMD